MNKQEIKEEYDNLLERVKTKDYFTRIDLTNRINCYQCDYCGHITKTRDVDPGTIPFYHECEKCKELAKSTLFKDVIPDHEPTQEWYRPDIDELMQLAESGQNHLVEHILMSGLLVRPCKTKEQ